MTNLNIDIHGKLPITLESVIGEKIAVLGLAGSGKTNSAAVIIEELLAGGLPMTIVDIEGEYWGLKDRFDIIVIGRSENVDIEVDASHAAGFATYSVEKGVSLILDLSDYDMEEMEAFMLAYFEAIWDATFKARRPYEIVIEEAHEWMPQGTKAPLKALLSRFALRGRKRGVGMIIISQRSAKVDKNSLTQARLYFLHQVTHPTDLNVYKDILPLSPRVIEERVATLRKGDAYVMLGNSVSVETIRLRHTYHAGATPGMDATRRVQMRPTNDVMLAELRKFMTMPTATKDDGKSEAVIERLRAEAIRREGVITAQKGEIGRLNGEVQRLTAELEKAHKATATKPVATASNGVVAPAKRPGVLLPTTRIGPDLSPSKGVIARSEQDIARQQRRWSALLGDLSRVARYKRDILIYLVEREGTAYTVKQLARALVLSEETIRKNPPTDLIQMGMIRRRGIPGGFTHESSVREKLKELLPALDVERLIVELLRRLKQ